MKNIALPKFQATDRHHGRLADLSIKAHQLVAQGKSPDAEQQQIDRLVEALWNTKP